MRTSSSRSIRCGRAVRLGLSALAASLLPFMAHAATTDTSKPTGIACTSSGSPNATFTLVAKPGYIQLPDGTTAYMWSYANGGTAFQHPGPVLCVNEGDTVTVILTNSLTEPVSIMFPGQENVLADGAPAQPQFSGTGALVSLTNAVPPGGSISYSFVATNPGSYIYESGTLPHQQVRMGLFGALVVRPATGADRMYNRADSQYTTNTKFSASGPQVNEEYMVLLSEIDPYQHYNAEAGYPFDFNYYLPRYRLINGRGFPDSIADNFSPYLPDQPYGALARIHPKTALHPYPGAIRYLNVGSEEFPFHPHGNNGRVVGRDGRALANATGQDLSMEKFAINIGPGQAWDVIFDWQDAENYSLTNPVDVTIPQVNNQQFGMFYSGSPYLGKTGPLPPGASTLNTCGEFYIISHNHALFQMSSWGVNATGPITYVRVDPPMPNSCQ
jgi:FtsP/CotA-like multicopper oxidase with cupredoxin domain